jgi:hypothetical protein
MEQVCCSVCVLVVCAVLVPVLCDGSSADPVPRTDHIATASNSSTGWDRKEMRFITVWNSDQTPEAVELEPPPKSHYEVNANTTYANKLGVETFIGVNRSATTGRMAVDENMMEGKSLETDTIVHNSSRNVDNLELTTASNNENSSTTKGNIVKWRAIDNVLADSDQIKPENSENVLTDISLPITADRRNIATGELLEQTTQKDVNSAKIQGLDSNTEMVAIVGHSASDNKQIKSFVNNNNITSGKDWNQVDADVVSAATEENRLPLRTTNIQKSNEHTIRIRRNSASNDEEDKMIESVSEEMRNKNKTNEEYINDKNSKTACNKLFSVVITQWKIFPNGSLLSLDDTHVLYPPEYFWKELNDDNVTEVRGCLCLLRNCIRKCCPEGQTLTKEQDCVPSNLSLLHPFSPQFIDEHTNKPVKNVDVHRLYGNPCSYGGFLLDPAAKADDQFTLLLTGILSAPAEGNFTVAQYCIEAFEEQKAILPLLCLQEEGYDPVTQGAGIHLMYPIGLIISVPFLFATFFVYAVISELRNLHGKSLMCHVSSLLTAYLFLAVVQLGEANLSNEFCIFCGKCS